MKRPVVLILAAAVAIGIGTFVWYRRTAPGGSTAVDICARDIYGLYRESGAHALSRATARTRCECITRELGKDAEGREVLKLVVEYDKFLTIIESAASHAGAFEAMTLCNGAS